MSGRSWTESLASEDPPNSACCGAASAWLYVQMSFVFIRHVVPVGRDRGLAQVL
jgi:hypothetical protein